MEPKPKRYWLIGGTTYLFVSIVIFIFAYFRILETVIGSMRAIFIPALLGLQVLFLAIAAVFGNVDVRHAHANPIIFFACAAIFFATCQFLPGAILGWLYGKIKNRKQITS